jgi:periplasmic copper chaperone A
MMKTAALIVGAAVAALATAASAHVVLAPAAAPAGSYVFGAFRVGHGCAGAATTALRIELPPDLLMAKPQPKPGWSISIEHAPLARPVQGEGGRRTTQRVTAITWTGGPLPDDEWDEFGVSAKLPAKPGPLYFRAIQTCGTTVERWTDMPVAGQGARLPHPAPVLTVTPAAGPDPMAGMKMGDP